MAVFDVVLLVLGYVVTGAAVGSISYTINDDDATSFFIGAFWPLSLPIIGTIFSVFCLVSGVNKLVQSVFRKSAEQRVIGYSESPTKILSQIIASKILAAPELLNKGSGRWVSEDKKINVWYSVYSSIISNLYGLKVNEKEIFLPKEDKDVIVKALNKALEIKLEREKADAKAKEQLVALEAVESLLLQPVKEEGETK